MFLCDSRLPSFASRRVGRHAHLGIKSPDTAGSEIEHARDHRSRSPTCAHASMRLAASNLCMRVYLWMVTCGTCGAAVISTSPCTSGVRASTNRPAMQKPDKGGARSGLVGAPAMGDAPAMGSFWESPLGVEHDRRPTQQLVHLRPVVFGLCHLRRSPERPLHRRPRLARTCRCLRCLEPRSIKRRLRLRRL